MPRLYKAIVQSDARARAGAKKANDNLRKLLF